MFTSLLIILITLLYTACFFMSLYFETPSAYIDEFGNPQIAETLDTDHKIKLALTSPFRVLWYAFEDLIL